MTQQTGVKVTVAAERTGAANGAKGASAPWTSRAETLLRRAVAPAHNGSGPPRLRRRLGSASDRIPANGTAREAVFPLYGFHNLSGAATAGDSRIV